MATTPRATEILWPDPEQGPWMVLVSWRVQHGTFVPVGLELRGWITTREARTSGPHNHLPRATDDAELPRIDARLIRSLPVGEVIDAARDQLTALLTHERDQSDWPQAWRDSFERWRADTEVERHVVEEGGKPGRGLGVQHYAEVADVYRAAVRAGQAPTEAVRQQFQVTKSAAAKQVRRARILGLLPPTSRGRVGRLEEDL